MNDSILILLTLLSVSLFIATGIFTGWHLHREHIERQARIKRQLGNLNLQ